MKDFIRTVQVFIITMMTALSYEDVVAGQPPLILKRVNVERLPDLNTPREGHAVFYAGGELVVAGGHTTGFQPTPTAEYLRDGEWHQVPMTYIHDHGTALVLRSGRVILMGGSKEELGVGQTFGAEIYDPDNHIFTGFGCLYMKRTLASAIETDSGQVIVTGNWYADDGIEKFDGQRFFSPVKPVTQGRAVPFLFRTSSGDILIVGDRDTYDHQKDTIIVDRLYGDAFEVPLLRTWKPMTYNAPITADVGFIGQNKKGEYTYMMAAKNFARTDHRNKPELKGKPAGQVAIVLVSDTVFSLLPTSCPIPMMSPLGTGPIFYDRSCVMADKKAHKAYLCGVGKDKRLYVVCIDYAQEIPPPISLYYTEPLADCGFYSPAITPQGNLVIVGGSSKPNYDSDNFTPTSSAWLVLLGNNDEADTYKSCMPTTYLIVLLVFAALLVFVVIFIIGKSRAAVRHGDNSPELIDRVGVTMGGKQNDQLGKELYNQICQLMDERQLFRNSELKVQDVAAEIGTNVRYVTKSIKLSSNLTFTQFVNQYRVGYAKRLLRQQADRKIIDIYTEAGFASERSFFRIFKESTGMTTSEWLNQENA